MLGLYLIGAASLFAGINAAVAPTPDQNGGGLTTTTVTEVETR